jgi:hypothetical protein
VLASWDAVTAAAVLSGAPNMMALFRGSHEGNIAAIAAGDRISRAPGDSCAKAFQDATNVPCPGSSVTLLDMLHASVGQWMRVNR